MEINISKEVPNHLITLDFQSETTNPNEIIVNDVENHCLICKKPKENKENLTLTAADCGHKICLDCLNEYIHQGIRKFQKLPETKCPEKSCNNTFKENHLERLLSNKILLKYNKTVVQNRKKDNGEILCCNIGK